MGFGPGHIFKTRNGGTGWLDVTGNLQTFNTPVNSILIDPIHNNDVYVATDIGVFVADDSAEAANWQYYGQGLPRTAVLQLKMSSVGPQSIVAATHGRGAWEIQPLHESPDFWLGADRSVQNVVPGSTARPVTITAESANHYSGAIQITCTSPEKFKCTVGKPTLSIGQSTLVTFAGAIPAGTTQFQIKAYDGRIARQQTVVVVAPVGEQRPRPQRLQKPTQH